jgi:putative spermidine/putrescine transport system permease protein
MPTMADGHGSTRRFPNMPDCLLNVVCWLVLAFLVLPIVAIVPLSFNGGSFLVYPLEGVSLRWYEEVLTSRRWLSALGNSLVIGLPATVLATVLGTLAAVGLNAARFPGKAVIGAVLISPVVVPVIITALGVYLFFAPLGLANSHLGLILAHAALGAPFVVVTVAATLAGFDVTLIRAATSLGAPALTVFRRVTLPLILPGVASGGLFAFAASLDDVVVVLFLGGPAQRTLPRELFDGVREHVTPAITVVATLLVVIASLMMLAMEALRRRSERLRGP